MLVTVGLFLIGLIIIIKGVDMFVDSAVWVAEATGMPKMLIGATIVSLATTLPELFVSSIAVLSGSTDMGVGNAIGSVICNTGLIMAISMMASGQALKGNEFRNKGVLMSISCLILLLLGLDLNIGYFDSFILIVILAFYIWMNVAEAKIGVQANRSRGASEKQSGWTGKIAKFIIGCTFIVIGAKLMVDNGVKIAEFFNVPERIIGLTIIALGPSLPELVTTVTAIAKREYGMSVGNILGANVLNIAMILPVCSLISKGAMTIPVTQMGSRAIPTLLYIDIPVAILLLSIVVVPGVLKKRLSRWQGYLCLAIYLVYISFLLLF